MPERKEFTRRVVLVGWDGADWALINPLLDAGLMPNLQKLVERGVMGKVETLQPPLSPLLWTSIATGKTADQHGILGFLEPDPVGGRARPVTSSSRATKALWNILHQSGLRSLVLNWFASHPAESIDGVCVSNLFCKVTAPLHTPWPIVPRAVHPAGLQETLAGLRVHPGELTGDDLLLFMPRLADIDQKTDKQPLKLAAILAETITTQAAATWLMENEPWDFLAVYHGALDQAGHHFMRYRAPRMSEVAERDFENYKDVIDGLYCFHDLMLGSIVELAGPDAVVIVVSDHGFHSGRFRPTAPHGAENDDALMWHRSHGILCMAGPGIRRDELVYGAGLLDIAPTVLALFGLPAGADMPGRVLAEVFENPFAIDPIPSWEDVPGGAAAPGETDAGGGARKEDAWAAAAVLAQLADLGYIDSVGEDAREGLRRIRNDRTLNLARVHLAGGRAAEAIPLIEEVIRETPEARSSGSRLYLAQALFKAGRLQECRTVVEDVLALKPRQAVAHVIQGNLALAEGDVEQGLACLLKAEEEWKDSPHLQHLIGQVYMRSKKWDDAERCFRAVIAFESDAAESHAGLARCLMEKGELQEAAGEAMDAIGLKFNMPGSHYVLGVSLARLGQTDRAVQAFETCLKLAPGTVEAREWLAGLQVHK
jgi:predicted AlkP superfamily phosphohydrolase/phosphomutase/tetratricopeptide (TPR) repeat protein